MGAGQAPAGKRGWERLWGGRIYCTWQLMGHGGVWKDETLSLNPGDTAGQLGDAAGSV